MAKRKFAKLKNRMYEAEVTQQDVANRIGRGLTYISRRLNAKEPFNTEDIRCIAALLDIPRGELFDYFMEG